MKRRKIGQRIGCIGLAIAVLLPCLAVCAPAAIAAEKQSAEASTMHLEKARGTVRVEDTREANVPVREGMQLYSGYELETGRDSYAWISLDKTKAAKLDVLSSAQVRQHGRKLEIILMEGGLFFDVSRPLEAEESLNIRTSTMIMGIRGTCGWIDYLSKDVLQIALLEGKADVESTNPETGAARTVTVEGGQVLTIVCHGESGGLDRETIDRLMEDVDLRLGRVIYTDVGLRMEELKEEYTPEFVGREVADSLDLQRRITEKTTLSVEKILESLRKEAPPAARPTSQSHAPSVSGGGNESSSQPPADDETPEKPELPDDNTDGEDSEDGETGEENEGNEDNKDNEDNEDNEGNESGDKEPTPPPADWPEEYGERIWYLLTDTYGYDPHNWPEEAPPEWGLLPWPPLWPPKQPAEGTTEEPPADTVTGVSEESPKASSEDPLGDYLGGVLADLPEDFLEALIEEAQA